MKKILSLLLLAASATSCTNMPTDITNPEYTVVKVIDGDTIKINMDGQEVSVRTVGDDTPEKGQCGWLEAKQNLVKLIDNHKVWLDTAGKNDRDRYGRLIRYIYVGTKDLGLEQIKSGWAVARYDSRDKYPRHPKEALYHKADEDSPVRCGR